MRSLPVHAPRLSRPAARALATLGGLLAAIAVGTPAASAAQPATGQPVPGITVTATQEVARTHPVSGSFYDSHMTLVKYYNTSGQYWFCVANYHHSGEVTNFLAFVDWSNGITDTLPLPGPGGTKCTPPRAAHGAMDVEYVYAGAYWVGLL